jgi:hypothetical protein
MHQSSKLIIALSWVPRIALLLVCAGVMQLSANYSLMILREIFHDRHDLAPGIMLLCGCVAATSATIAVVCYQVGSNILRPLT